MVYRFMKMWLTWCMHLFFRDVKFIGAKPVESGPLLVVGNHQYSIMDPMLIALAYRRPFWFLAKATLFRGRFLRWLMRHLNMVPINRPQDGGSLRDNPKTLDDTAVVVATGKALIAFLEGRSDGKRQLGVAKNGLSRVALLALTKTLDNSMLVQVAGITYSNLRSPFRSTVTIKLEEPITVAQWREQCEKHMSSAAKDLTKTIETSLRRAVVDVPEDHDEVAEHLAALYGHKPGTDYSRFQVIADELVRLGGTEAVAQQRERLTVDLARYHELTQRLRIVPGDERRKLRFKWLLWLVSPFVFLGWWLHYAPYQIAKKLSLRNEDRLAGRGYLRFKTGVFTFAGWYLGIAAILGITTAAGGMSVIAAGCVFGAHAVLGWLAVSYLRLSNVIYRSAIGDPLFIEMRDLGSNLIAEIDAIRKSAPNV